MKANKISKIVAAILAAVLLLLAIVYFVGVGYFKTHFLPNTVVDGMNCKYMTAGELTRILDKNKNAYVFQVLGRDMTTEQSGALMGELTYRDIGFQYTNLEEFAQTVFDHQKPYQWPLAYLRNKEEFTYEPEFSFDEERVKDNLSEWSGFQKNSMTAPKNAYIKGYSAESKHYEIAEETAGTVMDTDKAAELILQAIADKETSVDLDKAGCYSSANIDRGNAYLNQIVTEANELLRANITYNWYGAEVKLDADTIQEWIGMNAGHAYLKEESVAEFVSGQAEAHDTYGDEKAFHTALGATVVLPSKKYGWKTDVEAETAELLQLILEGKEEERVPVASITASSMGENDIGDSYVEADLTNQHLYVFVEGEIVLETDFVSGTLNSTKDCVTPEGIFSVVYKKRNAILRGPNYASPVSYWMPFYGNYGMHDATWRRSFGGDIYKRNGSHGCINLPKSAAKEIYDIVDKGFPVICYYYEVNPLDAVTETEPIEVGEDEAEPTIQSTQGEE